MNTNIDPDPLQCNTFYNEYNYAWNKLLLFKLLCAYNMQALFFWIKLARLRALCANATKYVHNSIPYQYHYYLQKKKIYKKWKKKNVSLWCTFSDVKINWAQTKLFIFKLTFFFSNFSGSVVFNFQNTPDAKYNQYEITKIYVLMTYLLLVKQNFHTVLSSWAAETATFTTEV